MSGHGSLLRVSDLRVEFSTERSRVRAVDGVSFEIAPGESVALVGESGCGKTATGLALLGLLPKPQGQVVGGSAVFDGRELLRLPPAQLRALRGRRVAMIFQDPMTSLNPYLRVEEQLVEVVKLHLGTTTREARKRAVALLDRVGIPDPAGRMRAYPHQLSGGMRQRVMIAMALLCDPELLIADEPTTALDVTIQAQILELIASLREERDLAVLHITHDLAVVAGSCQRMLVMYAGAIVEEGSTQEVFARPGHPYTAALARAVPRLDGDPGSPLESLDGLPPRLDQGPFRECRFAPRCALVRAACRQRDPELTGFGQARRRRCVVPVEEIR